ncbi:hypothetical protein BG418_21685 [Streptomyces sp. CBMA152]|nr:hypothetical protein [Streptomyces sp. CBMA152]
MSVCSSVVLREYRKAPRTSFSSGVASASSLRAWSGCVATTTPSYADVAPSPVTMLTPSVCRRRARTGVATRTAGRRRATCRT